MLNPFDPTPQQPAPTRAADPVEVTDAAADAAVDTPVVAEPAVEAESAEPAPEVDDDEVYEADEVLAGSIDLAREALTLITPADTIGEPLGYIVEGEHVLSLLFDCLMTGYPGWRWTVSLSRVDADAAPMVLETELTPGDDALLAPEWVPWSDRLADAKVAEELAAAEAEGDEDDDSDEDDSDEDSDDEDDADGDDEADADESAEAEDDADDGVDPLDGIDFNEALAASEHDPDQTGQAQGQTDDGAPQPPADSGGTELGLEDQSENQGR